MPVYDAESMNITAGQVDRIAEDFRRSKAAMRGVEGVSPFGEVEDPDNPEQVSATLHSFTTGMRAEFDAAASLVSAAGTALRDAVRAMTETDTVAADNLTLRDVR
ncbi:hypothetical protein FHU38_005336 [Saccharomonospora amisosensis]|uniref:PE family protein n=1 Tax=Saccharomonospora amisosensis TaxID=1128677 RepID=A0A7X5UVG6_9PSEU|nr:hypothetical protein [Saccharomonospora amisosensis]NIJ14928.1 hypothetical protein [Saccharomonospora amisosensis]